MDLACADVVHFEPRKGAVPRVMLPKEDNDAIYIKCYRNEDDGSIGFRFKMHHLVMYGLDPENELFEAVQRFTTFRGYCDRKKYVLVRPKDNCLELEETLDADGDALTAVCKTDGEHGMGYRFHNLFAVWKCHHTVNKWFHVIRTRAGSWLHACVEEEYAEKQEDRQYPSFYRNLPKTLAEEERQL